MKIELPSNAKLLFLIFTKKKKLLFLIVQKVRTLMANKCEKGECFLRAIGGAYDRAKFSTLEIIKK